MEDKSGIPQLLLRCALGITFIIPVFDRLGILGPAGTGNIEWGNWKNFIDYTATLIPHLQQAFCSLLFLFTNGA